MRLEYQEQVKSEKDLIGDEPGDKGWQDSVEPWNLDFILWEAEDHESAFI